MRSSLADRKGSLGARRGLVLGLLVVAQFVVILDFSIVQIALPTMRTELHISIADSQWIVSAFGITIAGLLLLSARAADSYGRRRVFSIGLLTFALASLSGGLAPSEVVLIVSRALQGVGAAMASSTALSLLQINFPEGPERNRALSVFAAVSSAGFAAGVVLGGALTAAFGWRSVFFINVPIGLVAAFLAPRIIAESKVEAGGRHLDLPGALAVTAGLALLVYGLTEAASASLLSSQSLVPLGLSALALVAFLFIERSSKAPLLPLAFFRRRVVLASNFLALARTAAQVPIVFLLTIYLQQVKGYSALDAGLAFVPQALVFMFAGGYLASRLASRFGTRLVLVSGMAVMAAGSVILSGLTVQTSFLLGILPSMLLVAFGGAISFTADSMIALASAAHGEEGLASGLLNTSTQVGGPIGLAAAVTIAGIAGSGTESALVAGFGYAFLGGAVVSALGVVVAASIGHARAVVTPGELARLRAHEPISATQAIPPSERAAVTPTHPETLKRILVAVDGSLNGERAAEKAIQFAKDYAAELLVLRVVKTPVSYLPATPTGSGGPAVIREYYDLAQKDARGYVDVVVAKARGEGVEASGEVVRTTVSPAGAIVGRARLEHVDLIIIGSRGLDRSRRLLLGSVSAGVAANPDIATLVVK
jgi:EmrB/QacA subfamily drug resistance transporter